MLLLNFKSKEIELFGQKLLLSERTAGDINRLMTFSKKKKEKDFTDYMIESAIVIADGLKINYTNLKWYNYFKKKRLEKLLSSNNILKNLSPNQIKDLGTMVYEIEGLLTDKKKVKTKAAEAEKQSAETLQSV